MTTENASSGMLLYGVQAIADFLGIRKRQALGLIERGHLPHYHVGKIVCANRATVTAWLKAREAAANPAKPEDSDLPASSSAALHPTRKGPRHVR